MLNVIIFKNYLKDIEAVEACKQAGVKQNSQFLSQIVNDLVSWQLREK